MTMFNEYWVVGGTFRDATCAALADGGGELYGPFACYEEAMHSWSARSEGTRAHATVRYSIVVTAARSRAHETRAMAVV
ncbi:MAG: hypothetical protein WD096_09370 [Actinomycetota bacterium]